jgi:hypothetical protein
MAKDEVNKAKFNETGAIALVLASLETEITKVALQALS